METNDKTTAMPTLTLDPFGAQAAAEQQTAAAEPVKTCDELMQENSNLSADELAAVDAFAKQIYIIKDYQRLSPIRRKLCVTARTDRKKWLIFPKVRLKTSAQRISGRQGT